VNGGHQPDSMKLNRLLRLCRETVCLGRPKCTGALSHVIPIDKRVERLMTIPQFVHHRSDAGLLECATCSISRSRSHRALDCAVPRIFGEHHQAQPSLEAATSTCQTLIEEAKMAPRNARSWR